MEQIAARLAGGFLEPINLESLKVAIQTATKISLGELDQIKTLPGFQQAVANTLTKAWNAGIDLKKELADSKSEVASHRRSAMVNLEREVLRLLPGRLKRPQKLAELAIQRAALSSQIFGKIEFIGFIHLTPVWRDLILEIAEHTEVTWYVHSNHVPEWITNTSIIISQWQRQNPSITTYSCANPNQEVLEAIRWARSLIVKGTPPDHIAICTPSPQSWDAPMLAQSEASGLPVHFIHGLPVLSMSPGQLAASLAEILLHGLSRTRMIRFVALLRTHSPLHKEIPSNWWRKLPGAPLLQPDQWIRAIEDLDLASVSEGPEIKGKLKDLIHTLNKGPANASAIGQTLLRGTSLTIWKKAIKEGPVAALDLTLNRLRMHDGKESGSSIAWGPASVIAANPRPYNWSLGMTSRTWPRKALEDPLLPSHIISPKTFDPFPLHEADRCNFQAILTETSSQIVCSRSRRDSEGRLNGKSSLYPKSITEIILAHRHIPDHASSVSDRLLARPEEFSGLLRAQSARQCWNNWRNQKVLTSHDGQIRPQHPLLCRALNRPQSATSLVKLLRDPINYLWTYGFHWSEPEEVDEPLELDPLSFGSLIHEILERSVNLLTAQNKRGLSFANEEDIDKILERARIEIDKDWSFMHPLPPPDVWSSTLNEAMQYARVALNKGKDSVSNGRSWAEVPFGNGKHSKDLNPNSKAELPWDPTLPVCIPDSAMNIAGSIDRLDLGDDGMTAKVTDYKSGNASRAKNLNLNGGKELQRCLYAFAAKTLLKDNPTVQAELIYLKHADRIYMLQDPEGTLKNLATYIAAAENSFLQGNALPGPAAKEVYYDFRFALPAGAQNGYLKRKLNHVEKALSELAPLWGES